MPPERSRRAAPPGPGALVLILLALLALAWWLERSEALAPARAALRGRAVTARAFGAGALARALRGLGAVHALPPTAAPGVDPSGFDREDLAFTRPETYALERIPRHRVARELRIDPRWLERDVAVVSLLVPATDLTELAANSRARGRAWERRGYFGYVENGEHRFGSYVGVRLHGGWTRRATPDSWSYRIYFRNRYGHDRFPVPLFPGRRRDPPSELVVRNDGGDLPGGETWFFRSPLAYDIARRIGLPAPHTKHALLFVNGLPVGIRALTEFIQRDYLRARFGIEEPILVRTKRELGNTAERVREGDPAVYRRFVLRASDPAVGSEWIRATVEVDNLYRWLLAVLFCGTADPFQGALVRASGQADARWFWVAWDLDGSFGSYWRAQAWRVDRFVALMRKRDQRSRLLRRLFSEAGERRAFLELAVHELNHGLTDEFLDRRWRHYRDVAAAYGLAGQTRASLARMREYLLRRKDVLRAQLAGRLADGRGHRVRVAVPRGRRLQIDGRLREGPYSGWYLEDMEIVLTVPAGEAAGFLHWQIDGRPLLPARRELRHRVTAETSIEAVFTAARPPLDAA